MERPQESIIGDSAALALALERISQLAPINRPVLILGERGTGKELAAERLHFLSTRWESPLLKVNCAAIAETLLESELFGHEAGSFTGATRTQRGRFERADGGTLFLDELATMSTRLQEKLLRLVEYGEFERLGGQETLKVDVRVIAATNADLKQLAADGKFRHDLLDRLSFDVVHLPSLRQRREDIPVLATHFAIGMCGELGWELFPGFSDRALNELRHYEWPGNIRELKNVVERSLYRWNKPSDELDKVVIDPFVSPYDNPKPAQLPSEPQPIDSATTSSQNSSSQNSSSQSSSSQSSSSQSFSEQLERIEKQLLQEALAANRGHQRHTAEALGLSYDQLRGMVRKHGLSKRRRASRPSKDPGGKNTLSTE